MKYIAVVCLALAGLVELALRTVFVLLLVLSIIGIFLLIDGNSALDNVLNVVCWQVALKLVDAIQREPKSSVFATGEDSRAALATAWARGQITDQEFDASLDRLIAKAK